MQILRSRLKKKNHIITYDLTHKKLHPCHMSITYIFRPYIFQNSNMKIHRRWTVNMSDQVLHKA